MIELVLFSVLTILTIGSSLLVVTLRNVFHSALFMILALVGVGGFYALLSADFVFVVQLLVYAGGVMVLLLFVILLSGKPSDWMGSQSNEHAWLSAVASMGVFGILAFTIVQLPMKPVPHEPEATTAQLGRLLLTEMVLPFEIISLVLVAALVGAVYFSTKRMS